MCSYKVYLKTYSHCKNMYGENLQCWLFLVVFHSCCWNVPVLSVISLFSVAHPSNSSVLHPRDPTVVIVYVDPLVHTLSLVFHQYMLIYLTFIQYPSRSISLVLYITTTTILYYSVYGIRHHLNHLIKNPWCVYLCDCFYDLF